MTSGTGPATSSGSAVTLATPDLKPSSLPFLTCATGPYRPTTLFANGPWVPKSSQGYCALWPTGPCASRRYAQPYRSVVRLPNVWLCQGAVFGSGSATGDFLLQEIDGFADRGGIVRRYVGCDPDVVVLRPRDRPDELERRDGDLTPVGKLRVEEAADAAGRSLTNDRCALVLFEAGREDFRPGAATIVQDDGHRQLVRIGETELFDGGRGPPVAALYDRGERRLPIQEPARHRVRGADPANVAAQIEEQIG